MTVARQQSSEQTGPVRLVPLPRPTMECSVADAVPSGQGLLSLEITRSAPPAPRPDSQGWDIDDDPRPAPGDPGRLPDPRRWAAMLAQAVVEVLAGRRPATQLVRWLDLEVYERVRRSAAAPSGRRTGVPVRVRRVRVSTSVEGWVEAVAVVDDGTRCRAMAVRLEALQRRWLCTALDII